MRTNTQAASAATETPLTFETRGETVHGTHASPAGDGPFPTAVLLAGSGPLDRDGNHKQMALNIQRDLAALLAEAGWASLRYDKVGVGESTGDYHATGLFEEGADARAAVEKAARLADGEPVVVIGHSAGGIHCAALAASDAPLAGAVLLSSPAQDGESVLVWQGEKIGKHSIPGFVKLLMKLVRTDPQKDQRKAIAKLRATTTDSTRIQLQKVNAKWMREMLDHDPAVDIAHTRVPLLAITGTKDIQVDVNDLEIMRRAAGDRVTTVAAGSVDHLLRHDSEPHSRLQHYREHAKQPLSPEVTDPLLAWLRDLRRG